jgi:PKD repeat protein
MSNNTPNNSSRRNFIRNTSLTATGFFLLPRHILGSGFADPSSKAFAVNNPTKVENAKAGTTAWQLTNPALNREIEGYASLTSVNRGGQIKLFISVEQAQQVNLQIYRMGWYSGTGARLLTQANIAGINQPTPTADPNGLIECEWTNPYTLTIPNNTSDATDWASGVYLAKLTGGTSGKQSYIIFIVRDDARISDFLYQASFSTYQAYNNWPYRRDCGTACPGSRSSYSHNSYANVPAWKVSFDRPFAVGLAPGSERGVGAGEFLNTLQPGSSQDGAGWEYNMVRWLEMKGYDVTYATSIDTHEKTDLFLNGTTKRHKGFFSVGHDEYWTWEMRDRVEQARDNGVSLGFFSSNASYWQVRFEASQKTGQANRTMVAYRYDALQKDPFATDGDTSNDRRITTLWRDSPPNRPEAAMIGIMYWGNSYYVDMVITNPNHWLCSGTNLALNERLTQLIGYEVDSVAASSPSNIEVIAHSPVIDTRYADTTIYTAPSGAVVFGAASNQTSWGLDDYNASGPSPLRPSFLNPKFQQMVSNLLARFVGDQFPVARPGGPYNGTAGTPVSFNGSSSSDADGTIVSYTWTFGDGTTATGVTASHAYASNGTYTVNLVVVDDMGAAHSSSTSVVIGNATTTLNAPSGLYLTKVSGNSGQIKLTWVDNSNNEQLFRIERSVNPTSGFTEIAQVNANVITYTEKPPQKNTTYYYRVRASSGSTFSAYSNTASTANAIAGTQGQANGAARGERDSDITVQATELNIKALRNPSNGAFHVQIEGGSTNNISMRVIDMQGRLIEQRQNVQSNQVLYIGQNYAPGVYFIEAMQGAKRKRMKLLKSSK